MSSWVTRHPDPLRKEVKAESAALVSKPLLDLLSCVLEAPVTQETTHTQWTLSVNIIYNCEAFSTPGRAVVRVPHPTPGLGPLQEPGCNVKGPYKPSIHHAKRSHTSFFKGHRSRVGVVGIHSTNSFSMPALRGGFLSSGVISYRQEAMP